MKDLTALLDLKLGDYQSLLRRRPTPLPMSPRKSALSRTEFSKRIRNADGSVHLPVRRRSTSSWNSSRGHYLVLRAPAEGWPISVGNFGWPCKRSLDLASANCPSEGLRAARHGPENPV